MRAGVTISGGAHALLILWVLLGGVFRPDPPELQVADVSVLSEAEFAALTAPSPAPENAQDVTAPPTPDPDAAAPERPAAAEEAAPSQPPVESPRPPAPDAEPEPVAPPPLQDAEVEDRAPELAEPDPQPEVEAPMIAARPVPRPAPRVAPEPVQPPDPDAAVDQEVQQAATPDAVSPDTAEDPQEATSPEAATTEIVTEAEDPARAAPSASLRPRARPATARRPEPPAPAPERTAEVPDAPAPDAPAADAVADALAEALSTASEADGAQAPDPGLPEGPPMTRGERDALRLAVQRCWMVDVGSQAANVTVTVAMSMQPDGTVASGTLQMIGSEGGSGDAAQKAFEAARRAILRCQSDGYDLPAEKYAQWQRIEITFDPTEMRLR